jgi:superfamily II DNA or RNA helicase
MELREYQHKLIIDIKKQLKLGHKKICAVAPCGSGKSLISANIAASATKKGNRVLFLVHRKELCEQIKSTFDKCKVDFNLCNISMVQTVVRHLDKEPTPTIIIQDESHHSMANSYKKIYDHFSDAVLLGFTATPIRLNDGGLGEIYNSLVGNISIKWLIDNKFLASYKLFSKKLADTSKLHVRAGEYKKDEVNSLMEDNCIYGDTIKNYKLLADRKKTIVYCSSIKSSIETADAFNESGIIAKHLDGTTPQPEREEAVQNFRDNKIQVLCNVDLFSEGFDIPDCECVILLRPTKSLTLYIQQSMRAMRYKEGKEAIIIDHVGNCFEHGLVDEEREWSLESKKKKDKEVKIKECPICYAVMKPNEKICPNCGYIFQTQERKEKKVIDIELEEVTALNILANKPYNYYTRIKTLKKLIQFAKAKGFKSGWILHKIPELLPDLEMTFEDFRQIQSENGYKFSWIIHKCVEHNIEIPEQYKVMRRYANV